MLFFAFELDSKVLKTATSAAYYTRKGEQSRTS